MSSLADFCADYIFENNTLLDNMFSQCLNTKKKPHFLKLGLRIAFFSRLKNSRALVPPQRFYSLGKKARVNLRIIKDNSVVKSLAISFNKSSIQLQ